jgi:hypothetical protein
MKSVEKVGEKEIILESLLTAVVNGEQQKAEAIISKDPELLRLKGKINTDYSGRIIYGSALQIALGADDVSFFTDCESMAEMIERYFITLPESEMEIKKQIEAQFPFDLITRQSEQNRNDLFVLQMVMNAFLECKNDVELKNAINTFKNDLAQRIRKPINEGRHFNTALLKTAFEFYFQHYNEFEMEKNRVFWVNVIGYIQRFFPACYAQAFSQRLDYLVMLEEEPHRSLALRYSENVSFFPLDLNKNYRLGYDYAIYNGSATADPVKNPKNLDHIVYYVLSFLQMKEHALSNFIDSYLVG